MFHLPNVENTSVNLSSPRDLSLLASIDGRDNWCKFIRTPGLDLDKTKRLAVESDQIDLACDRHSFAVASDRNFEICDDETVAVFEEIFGGKSLAAFAEAWLFSRL